MYKGQGKGRDCRTVLVSMCTGGIKRPGCKTEGKGPAVALIMFKGQEKGGTVGPF